MIEKEQRQQSHARSQRLCLQALRLLAHLLVGLTVLAAALLSKCSLLHATSQLAVHKASGDENARDAWVWVLVLAVSACYAADLVVSVFNIVFRQQLTPSLFQLFVVSIVVWGVYVLGTSL